MAVIAGPASVSSDVISTVDLPENAGRATMVINDWFHASRSRALAAGSAGLFRGELRLLPSMYYLAETMFGK